MDNFVKVLDVLPMVCVLLLMAYPENASSQAVSFVKEPESITVISGGAVTLQCQINNTGGAIIGAVQWTRNNFALGTNRSLPGYPRYEMIGAPRLGEYNLMIKSVQLEDDAEFQCQVGAVPGFPGLMSQPASLTVLWPPSEPRIENSKLVSSNLFQLTVVAGTKTNVTCHADDGKPAADIAWMSGGAAVTENIYHTTETPNSYKQENAIGYMEFSPLRSDQNKVVECIASNAATGDTPKTAKVYLEVLFAPDITMTVSPRGNLREGNSQKFTCEAVGNPQEITWKWYEDDSEIEGASTNQLVLTSLKRDKHGRKIHCEGTNSVGSVKQSYILAMDYGPRFISEPKHVAVNLGQDAELHCNAEGNPSPAIFWRKKGSPAIVGSTDKLTVYNVRDDDLGAYTCTARVMGFETISRDVHLFKNGPPSITSEAEQSAVYNDDAVVECVAKSVPKATEIIWSRDGEVLNIPVLKRYKLVEQGLVDGNKSQIVITQVQNQDFGTFNCTVINSYGVTMKNIELVRKETIPVWVIAVAVIVGFLVVVITTIALCLWYRKKRGGSEYGSDSSENTLQKKDSKKKKVPTATLR